MRILIVNGYSKDPRGKAIFLKFQETIQEIFLHQRNAMDVEYEFVIRHRDDLEDFLFELESPYIQRQGAKAFDYIDLVFIEGDPQLLPWHPAAAKMLVLLRMCLRAKKKVFASAFAMQALVFLAATNTEKQIHIINGGGKGGNVNDLHNTPVGYSIRAEDFFLDNVTGDLFGFNHEKQEWIPRMNAGIHNDRAAQNHSKIGKYMQKTPLYKPATKGDYSLSYISRDVEDIAYIKKIYLQHWVINGLPGEFKIPSRNAWHIHQFNFVNPRKTFIVMAESTKGPQVIYFDSFCVGCLFPIDKKYPATIKILQNFVAAKIREIKSMSKDGTQNIEKISVLLHSATPGNFDLKHSEIRFKENNKEEAHGKMALGERKATLRIIRNANNNDNPKSGTFHHSGLAFTNHDGPPLLVENNTVLQDRIIRLNTQGSQNIGSVTARPTTSTGFNGSALKSARPMTSGSMHKDLMRTRSEAGFRAQSTEDLYDDLEMFNERGSIARNPGQRPSGILKTKPPEYTHEKHKSEIMMLLYPDLPREVTKDQDVWIPGHLSASRPSTSAGKKTVRVNSATHRGLFSTFTKFKVSDPDGARKTLIMTNGSPYMSEEEKYRLEQKEINKKNLGANTFKFTDKATKPVYISNYVGLTPSEPAIKHQFRAVSKDKWLAGNMRLC